MPLSKNKPAKAKAKRELVRSSSDTDKLPRNSQKNALGAGAKAQTAIKKAAVKQLVGSSATSKMGGNSRSDDGERRSPTEKAFAVSKKAGASMKLGSSASKTVAKRVQQSVAAQKKSSGR